MKGPTEPRRQHLLGSQGGLDKDDLCAGLVHVPDSQVGNRTLLCRSRSPTDRSDLRPHRPPFPSRAPSSAASVLSEEVTLLANSDHSCTVRDY